MLEIGSLVSFTILKWPLRHNNPLGNFVIHLTLEWSSGKKIVIFEHGCIGSKDIWTWRWWFLHGQNTLSKNVFWKLPRPPTVSLLNANIQDTTEEKRSRRSVKSLTWVFSFRLSIGEIIQAWLLQRTGREFATTPRRTATRQLDPAANVARRSCMIRWGIIMCRKGPVPGAERRPQAARSMTPEPDVARRRRFIWVWFRPRSRVWALMLHHKNKWAGNFLFQSADRNEIGLRSLAEIVWKLKECCRCMGKSDAQTSDDRRTVRDQMRDFFFCPLLRRFSQSGKEENFGLISFR